MTLEEEIARAIFLWGRDAWELPPDWDDLPDKVKMKAHGQAQAAIRVIRSRMMEPTEAAIAAGMHESGYYGDDLRSAFKAMTKVMLGETG